MDWTFTRLLTQVFTKKIDILKKYQRGKIKYCLPKDENTYWNCDKINYQFFEE